MSNELDNKIIANRLKQVREAVTPSGASAFSRILGMKQPTYARYESGDRTISAELIKALVLNLNLNTAWLFTGQGPIFLEETARLSRRLPDDNAAFWLHNWGERLLKVQKFFNYSDEKMAAILGVTLKRYLDLVTQSLFPKEKELNAFKDNFAGITIDELLYNDTNTFETRLKKDDKLEIDVTSLSPEKLKLIKNLLKET